MRDDEYNTQLDLGKRLNESLVIGECHFGAVAIIYVGLTNVSGSTNVFDSPNMSDYVIFPQTRPIFTTNASDLVGGKTSTTLTS